MYHLEFKIWDSSFLHLSRGSSGKSRWKCPEREMFRFRFTFRLSIVYSQVTSGRTLTVTTPVLPCFVLRVCCAGSFSAAFIAIACSIPSERRVPCELSVRSVATGDVVRRRARFQYVVDAGEAENSAASQCADDRSISVVHLLSSPARSDVVRQRSLLSRTYDR